MKTQTNPQPTFFKDPFFKVMMVSGLIKSTIGTFLMTMGGSILVYSIVQPGNYAWHAPIWGVGLTFLGVIVYFIGDVYKVMKKREEERQQRQRQQEQFLKTMSVVSELEEQLCRDIIALRGGDHTYDQPCAEDDYCNKDVPHLYDDVDHDTPPRVVVQKAIMVITGRGESATDSRILLELIRMNRDGKISAEQLKKASEGI